MRSEWVELEGVQVKSEHQFERVSEVVCQLSSEGKEGESEKKSKKAIHRAIRLQQSRAPPGQSFTHAEPSSR